MGLFGKKKNDAVYMQYPLDQTGENKLYDGKNHMVEPNGAKLITVNGINFCVLSYYDYNVSANMTTLLYKQDDTYYKIPLTDYSYLQDYLQNNPSTDINVSFLGFDKDKHKQIKLGNMVDSIDLFGEKKVEESKKDSVKEPELKYAENAMNPPDEPELSYLAQTNAVPPRKPNYDTEQANQNVKTLYAIMDNSEGVFSLDTLLFLSNEEENEDYHIYGYSVCTEFEPLFKQIKEIAEDPFMDYSTKVFNKIINVNVEKDEKYAWKSFNRTNKSTTIKPGNYMFNIVFIPSKYKCPDVYCVFVKTLKNNILNPTEAITQAFQDKGNIGLEYYGGTYTGVRNFRECKIQDRTKTM